MRISVLIDDSLQVYEIFNISDAKKGYLLATIVPHGEPIVIENVFDTENIIYKITLHGWADLSMYSAHYLTYNAENPNNTSAEDDDMEPEIEFNELEL